MQRRMNSNQVQYYIKRLRLFWPTSDIADEFDASALTIDRWDKGLSTPPLRRKPEFDKALASLCKQLHRKSVATGMAIFGEIAELLVSEPCPEWQEPPALARDVNVLRDLLIETLFGKTVKSTVVLKKTDELGFSRPQVYKELDRLSVTKLMIKAGRGGYSEWSMSRKSRGDPEKARTLGYSNATKLGD